MINIRHFMVKKLGKCQHVKCGKRNGFYRQVNKRAELLRFRVEADLKSSYYS